jgi:hypothetical protein
MNVQLLRFPGIILKVLRLEVSIYNVCTRGTFREVTVNSKYENSERLLSQLRPRIWPLEKDLIGYYEYMMYSTSYEIINCFASRKVIYKILQYSSDTVQNCQ